MVNVIDSLLIIICVDQLNSVVLLLALWILIYVIVGIIIVIEVIVCVVVILLILFYLMILLLVISVVEVLIMTVLVRESVFILCWIFILSDNWFGRFHSCWLSFRCGNCFVCSEWVHVHHLALQYFAFGIQGTFSLLQPSNFFTHLSDLSSWII